MSYLEDLLEKAENYMDKINKTPDQQITYFYRDKSQSYWDNDVRANSNLMKAYTKDLHGDPSSPVNGHLDCLCFSANPKKTSLYGNYRLNVPVTSLFNSGVRLYFTDFYCITKAHYVTLVVAERGSEADRHCQSLNLVELNMQNNCFIRLSPDGKVFVTSSAPKIWIEILYAHSIQLEPGFDLTSVPTIRKQSHRRLERPKRKTCDICNVRDPDVEAFVSRIVTLIRKELCNARVADCHIETFVSTFTPLMRQDVLCNGRIGYCDKFVENFVSAVTTLVKQKDWV